MIYFIKYISSSILSIFLYGTPLIVIINKSAAYLYGPPYEL